MSVPRPTPIYRFRPIECLPTIVKRGGMYAPNHDPRDGLVDRIAHDVGVQTYRASYAVNAGPGGSLLDYVPFYFGVLSPMLLRLATDRVDGYRGGQRPIVYLASTAQTIARAKLGFVFSDGQANKSASTLYDDLSHLDRVDGSIVNHRYWRDSDEDPDRMRRKQAEFLVHRFMPFELVHEVGVLDAGMKAEVEALLGNQAPVRPVVRVRRDWYYRERH